jgi:bacteriocin biosynthesis cyclodehydratase domain-containing protein
MPSGDRNGGLPLRALPVQVIECRDGVIVKRGRVEVRIAGHRAAEVVTLVLEKAAGGATREEIGAIFAAPDRPVVGRLVEELRARRILVEDGGNGAVATAREAAESALDVFYWHFDQRSPEVTERLNAGAIAVLGVNCISRQLASALSAVGVRSVDIVDHPQLRNLRLFDDHGHLRAEEWPGPRPHAHAEWADRVQPGALACLVATSDFGGRHLMRSWNEYCISQRCRFLPVVLEDLIGYVGPLVVPGETACYECLRGRENAHLTDPEVERASERFSVVGQRISGFHPSMASILGDLAALELSRVQGMWTRPHLVGTLIEVNLLAPALTSRKVLRIPRCSVCGTLNRHSAVSLSRNLVMPGNE